MFLHSSIHPLGTYSTQSIGAAKAFSEAIGHNPRQVTTLTQDTHPSKLVLILPTIGRVVGLVNPTWY